MVSDNASARHCSPHSPDSGRTPRHGRASMPTMDVLDLYNGARPLPARLPL